MGGPLHRLPADRGARRMTTSETTATAASGEAPLVGLHRVLEAAETLEGGRGPDAARAVRPARAPPIPQGGEPPADRRVQDPRRLRRSRLPLARGARPRRHHLLVGQPCPGRGPGRAPPRRTRGRRHAVRRARDQASARRGGRRRDRRRGHRQRRAPGRRGTDRRRARPRDHPAVRRRPGDRRPGHGRPRDRRSAAGRRARCSCRSAAAGSRAASP